MKLRAGPTVISIRTFPILEDQYMVRAYIIFGTFLCILFCYAEANGWKVIDPFGIGVSRPTGPGGHYHK